MAKSHKKPAPTRDTEVLYLRLPIVVVERVRKRAEELGWPHTIASVAAEAIEKGLTP